MSVEGFKPNFALYVDGLSITMLGVVVGVRLPDPPVRVLVHAR